MGGIVKGVNMTQDKKRVLTQRRLKVARLTKEVSRAEQRPFLPASERIILDLQKQLLSALRELQQREYRDSAR